MLPTRQPTMRPSSQPSRRPTSQPLSSHQSIFIVVFLGLCTLLCRGGGRQKVSWEEMEEKIASVDTTNKDTLGSTIPPLVFILGVQKGGSSSLMWHIITHPQLCSGVRKETHFFGGNYENLVEDQIEFEAIVEKYLSLFTGNVPSSNYVLSFYLASHQFLLLSSLRDCF